MRDSLWAAALAIGIGCGGGGKPDSGTTTPPEASCEPGRCLDDFATAIERDRAAARACYEAGHAKQPDLAGRIIVNFEVDPEGTVIDASQGIQGEQITEPDVVACVVDVVKGVKFAPSSAGKTTRAFHRFEFTPP